MERVFNDRDVDPRVRKILRKLGREVIGVAGITSDEVDDIVQDLILHLLTHPLTINPERGSMVGVVTKVARHKRSHMVASRCAAKRNHGQPPVSLSEPVNRTAEKSRTQEEVYDMDTFLNLTGKSVRTGEELGDLSLDVDRLLAGLSSELRRIATLLMYYRKTEVAMMLGIPWGTFCDRCRELRHQMRRMNLDEYAETSGKSHKKPVLDNKEAQMLKGSYEYSFRKRIDIDDVQDALTLAALGAENLHGRARLRLDGSFRLDRERRRCTIDASTQVGEDVARLFTGFLTRQFGEQAFRVRRQPELAGTKR